MIESPALSLALPKVRILAISLALTVSLLAVKKPEQRDWKIGTLIDSANASHVAGVTGQIMNFPNYSGYGPQMSMGGAGLVYRESVGFVIRGDVYVFMVSCPILRRRPSVTIHGTVKYSFEQGKFYLIDENFVEFEMTVIKKRLLDPETPESKMKE